VGGRVGGGEGFELLLEYQHVKHNVEEDAQDKDVVAANLDKAETMAERDAARGGAGWSRIFTGFQGANL
jgi:hypothetical protein